MTTTCQLSEPSLWKTAPTLRAPVPAKRPALAVPRPQAPPSPGSFSRLWRDALAEEDRAVAPYERMGFALLVFAAAAAVAASLAANSRFVEMLPAFTAWVSRLLGAG